jgi:lipopolysaccharide biosynthesis protein
MNNIRNALVIAHYNQAGHLRQDTLDALPVLHRHFQKIILVSTHLNREAAQKIPGFVDVHTRDNTGYDFYSYRAGIQTLLASGDDWQVTLMNTSFVIVEPDKLCDHYIGQGISRENFDVYGLVKSFEIVEHLQSFLLTFSNRLMRDAGFVQWWDTMQALNARHEVIYAYELGLSQYLSKAGYPLVAAMTSQGGTAIANPSHAHYQELLATFGIVKIELIRDNPFNINLNRLLAMTAHNDVFRRMVREGLDN